MLFDRNKHPEQDEQNRVLKSIAMFEELSEETIKKILEKTTKQSIKNGATLIKKGEGADDFYIVLKGKFVVKTQQITIAEISQGEPIGEIAFFAGGLRTADVIATRNSEVLQFTRDVYEDLSHTVPEIAWGIISTLARRVAASNPGVQRKVNKTGRSVALMAYSDGAMPAGFLAKIRTNINKVSGWKFIDEDIRRAEMEANGNTSMSDWLSHVDEQEQHVLSVCSTPEKESDWAEALIENSDHIFVVCPSGLAEGGPLELSSFEQILFNKKKSSQIQLVLWREMKEHRAKFSKNWLKFRTVCLHHQVSLDAADDFNRLSSFIQGKSFNLFN